MVATLGLTLFPVASSQAKDAGTDNGQSILQSYGFAVEPKQPECGWNTLTYSKKDSDRQVVFNLHDNPAQICEFKEGEVGADKCNKKVSQTHRDEGLKIYKKLCP